MKRIKNGFDLTIYSKGQIIVKRLKLKDIIKQNKVWGISPEDTRWFYDFDNISISGDITKGKFNVDNFRCQRENESGHREKVEFYSIATF